MRRRVKPKSLTEVERLRKENIQLKEIMRKKLFYIGYLVIRLEKEFDTLRDEVNRIPKECEKEQIGEGKK